jgi:hypothetical protein
VGEVGRGAHRTTSTTIYIVAQGWLQHMSAENFIYLEDCIQKNEKFQTISKHP